MYAGGDPASYADPSGLLQQAYKSGGGSCPGGTAETAAGCTPTSAMTNTGSGTGAGNSGTGAGGSGTPAGADLLPTSSRAAYARWMRTWQDANPYAIGATRELDSLAVFCGMNSGQCPDSLFRTLIGDHNGLVAQTAVVLGLGAAGAVGRAYLVGGLGAPDLADVEQFAAERDLAAIACGGQSFTAGTRVLLASGKAVPIASLSPGDKVLATSTVTGRTQAEPVTAILVHRDTNLYDLKVKAGRKTGVIHTTASHLFWDPYLDKWVSANKLSKNEHLKAPDGAAVTVVGGTTPKVHDGWMWDLTVPGNNDHDFYVIPSGGYDVTGDVPVLVHNSPPGACSLTSAPDAPVINSKTVFTAKDGSFRIDLENQNPGEPGAGIHIQFMGRGADPAKYYYNPANGSWMTENGDVLSSRIAKQVPQSAINKAYQYLGLQVP